MLAVLSSILSLSPPQRKCKSKSTVLDIQRSGESIPSITSAFLLDEGDEMCLSVPVSIWSSTASQPVTFTTDYYCFRDINTTRSVELPRVYLSLVLIQNLHNVRFS